MFVLGVPIRQKTEVSQQKFVQKHSHQHTFCWFQSVPGKSGYAELVCTDTAESYADNYTPNETQLVSQNKMCLSLGSNWGLKEHTSQFYVLGF